MQGKHPFDHRVRVVLMTVGVLAVMVGPGRAQAPHKAEYEGIQVKPLTLPESPGTDTVRIELEETYDIAGVGRDTVKLEGTLVTRRGPVLLGSTSRKASWQTSTVVAEFTSLDLKGESKVFGPVTVSLDKTAPSFAHVTAGKCAAALGVQVEMSKLNLSLRTQEAVQLRSNVNHVPPIGDEKTVSVGAVDLVDRSGRSVGKLQSARVLWRTLVEQKSFTVAAKAD